MSGIRKAMVAVAMAVGVADPTSLTAQVQPLPQLPRVGDRVRILAPSIREDRYVGRVEGLPPDSIRLDTAGVRRRLGFDTGPVLVDEFRRVTLPTNAIQSIDVSAGRTHRKSTIKA